MHFTVSLFRTIWLTSFFLTSNNFAYSFNWMSFLSEILMDSSTETFRYRGYDGELSRELHPFFKGIYKLANTRKYSNESERTYVFDINMRPYFYFPFQSQFLTKWEIAVPVRNSSRFRNGHNFDLYANIPLNLILPYQTGRKRRSVTIQGAEFLRRKEDVEKLIILKRNEKLTFFNAVTETLDQFIGNAAKDCILKLICEIFESPFMEGILGDFINTIFRATVHDDWSDLSKHFNDDEYDDFIKAELHGRLGGSCKEFYSKCSRSAFDLLPHTNHHVIRRKK